MMNAKKNKTAKLIISLAVIGCWNRGGPDCVTAYWLLK